MATTTRKNTTATATSTSSSRSAASSSSSSHMYGDLVGSCMMLICSVFIIQPAFHDLQQQQQQQQQHTNTSNDDDPRVHFPGAGAAYIISIVYVWNAAFGLASWLSNNNNNDSDSDTISSSSRSSKNGNGLMDYNVYSILATIGFIAMIALQNLFSFPNLEGAIIPQFLWLLMVFSCNDVGGENVTFYYKLAQGLFAFLAILMTALIMGERTQVLLALGASTAIYVMFHYMYYNFANTSPFSYQFTELMVMHGARLGLAVYFVAHIAAELIAIRRDPSYAPQGGYAIVKGTCLAAFGLAALGTFRSEKTKRRELQQQVEQQEDKLRMVGVALQASETAVAVTTSATHEILWSNPAFKRLCCVAGCSSSSSSSSSANDNIAHALGLSDSNTDKLLRAYDTQSRKEDEIVIGSSTTFEVEISPFGCNNSDEYKLKPNSSDDSILSKDNNDVRFVVVLRDITERLARERAEDAAREEALLTKAMSESMETLTHELRTPLQGIRGVTSMLVQDKSLPSDMKDSLDLIMASSGLLLVLINNLLDVRKCHANMMDAFPLTAISCEESMKDAADFCRPLAVISGVTIDLESNNAAVLSNNLRLQQVIINLLSNAIKHSPEGSTIRINASIKTAGEVDTILDNALATGEREDDSSDKDKGEKAIIISVSDSGDGIVPDQAEKLFTKFAMLSNTRTGGLAKNTAGQPSGSGLGLNLCLKFVQLMHGNIWANNNVGEPGATFSFCLPMIPDDDHEAAARSEELRRPKPMQRKLPPDPLSPSNGESSSSRKQRVLLVDDTLLNRKVFTRMLQQVNCVATATAVASGPEALAELHRAEYDLVISDVQMPGMTGPELALEIKKSTTLMIRKPVVVGLTADTSRAVELQCIESGMKDVIHKPITVAEMCLYFDNVVCPLVDVNCSASQ